MVKKLDYDKLLLVLFALREITVETYYIENCMDGGYPIQCFYKITVNVKNCNCLGNFIKNAKFVAILSHFNYQRKFDTFEDLWNEIQENKLLDSCWLKTFAQKYKTDYDPPSNLTFDLLLKTRKLAQDNNLHPIDEI
jgi:hypothetical protein